MSNIREILENENDIIDTDTIIQKYPWLKRKNMKCILSPDSDGLLCGLFMSHYLGWEIVGFYDGKVAVIKDSVSVYDDDVCFLDIEIYKKGVKSIGHHMLSAYNTSLPKNWSTNFSDCINPNLLRNFDKNKFRIKYPLATIHLLISILYKHITISKLPKTAISPLLFVDGTFNVLFKYPENVMNWWVYLNIHHKSNPLNDIFISGKNSIYQTMTEMDDFFIARDKISIFRERGDRLKISDNKGNPYNIRALPNGKHHIDKGAEKRILDFIKLLSAKTGWNYNPASWHFNGYKLYKFSKSDFLGKKWTITKVNWNSFHKLNPLSWAMTSGNNIEFTIETPDKF